MQIEKKNELTRLVVENGQWVRNEDYEIIDIINYKMAHEYADYCSLCYLQSFATWNNYTNYGTSKVYLILHKDWKNVEKKHDDDANSPYDTYGRSMIFVFVDAEGNLVYCNTRWNHDATYDAEHSTDHALDEREISEIVGVNFYEVFKPKAKNLEDDPVYRLSKGDDIDDIFDFVGKEVNGLRIVSLNARFNVLNDRNELVSPREWFKGIENTTKHGQIIVKTNDNFTTILNRDGTYLVDSNYSNITLHGCGSYYVAANSNGNGHIINKNGKIISSYDSTKIVVCHGLHDSNGVMTNNYIVVHREIIYGPVQSFSIYSEYGRLIFEASCKDFFLRHNGWIVFLGNDDVYYHMSGDGKIIAKKEFGDITDIDYGGSYLLGKTLSGGHVLLNNQLEIISDEYYFLNSSSEFRGKYLLARSKASSCFNNYIDERGKPLLPHNTVCDSLFTPDYYTNEYAVVSTAAEANAFLKSDGTIANFNDKWSVLACYKKFAIVRKESATKTILNFKFVYNLTDYDGNLLLDEWCANIVGNKNILILTTSNGSRQILTTDLKPFFVDDIKLSHEDKIYIENYKRGICVVREGKCAYFDENGRWLFNKMWFDEMVGLMAARAVANHVGDKVYKLCPNGKVKEIKE